MGQEQNKYNLLKDLASGWAVQAELALEMTLRRLCDWAVAGAFPSGAFVDAIGEPVRPFDIYMASREVLAGQDGTVTLGGYTKHNDCSRSDLLHRVQISTQDVLAFCERIDVLPPPALQKGFERFRNRLKGRKHLAPPPCPDAEEHATRLQAGNLAEEHLNYLRHLLSSMKGTAAPIRSRPLVTQAPGPINVGFWTPRWDQTRRQAQADIATSGRADLQLALYALDTEWAAFAKERAASADVSLEIRAQASAAMPALDAKPSFRLVIRKSERLVVIDGDERPLAEKPLKLLCLLAERALRNDKFVSSTEIDNHLWGSDVSRVYRQSRDVVRDLRAALRADGVSGDEISRLIENRMKRGYRLALAADMIRIEE